MKITKQEQECLDLFEDEYQKCLNTKKRDRYAMRVNIIKGIINIIKDKKKNKE